MAAVNPTATSSKYDKWGSKNELTCTILAVADGDTFTPKGFSAVHNCFITPNSAVVVNATISGKIITFKVAAGTPDLIVTVIGE